MVQSGEDVHVSSMYGHSAQQWSTQIDSLVLDVVLAALSTSLTFLEFPASPKFHGLSDKKPCPAH